MHGDGDMILLLLHMTDWFGTLERGIFYFKIIVSDQKLLMQNYTYFRCNHLEIMELTTNLRTSYRRPF